MQHIPTTEMTKCLTEMELAKFFSMFSTDMWQKLSDMTYVFFSNANGAVYWQWVAEKEMFCQMARVVI